MAPTDLPGKGIVISWIVSPPVCVSVHPFIYPFVTHWWPNEQTYILEFWHGDQREWFLSQGHRVKGQAHQLENWTFHWQYHGLGGSNWHRCWFVSVMSTASSAWSCLAEGSMNAWRNVRAITYGASKCTVVKNRKLTARKVQNTLYKGGVFQHTSTALAKRIVLLLQGRIYLYLLGR